MKAMIVLFAAALGTAACSSSGGTDGGPDAGAGPCQTAQTALNFGDCADLIDAGGGALAQLTITPEQRSACEVHCSSSSDQTAVVAAFECLNAIPADAGPCTSAMEGAWETHVTVLALGCEGTLQSNATAACYAAVTTPPDAG
jgi:hypothetical protein